VAPAARRQAELRRAVKAFTIWQPWASLIMAGAKPYEFRRWALPNWMQGKRVVIHAGTRPMRRAELLDLLWNIEREPEMTGLVIDVAKPIVEKAIAQPPSLPLAAALGTAILGVPKRATEIYGGTLDSDRIEHSVWGWPLTEIQHFEPIVPVKGAQGFWNWPEGAS